MDIVFNPPVNAENQYVRILVDGLRAKGYRIHPLDTIFSGVSHFRSIRLVHLNWFEVVEGRTFFAALRSFLRKLTVLVAIKLSGKPLVWTMHNRASHGGRWGFFSRIITRLLVRWADRIVIHVRQSASLLATYGARVPKKAVYVPHPHFIGVYGDAWPPAWRADGRLHLLFVGMVKPYKNLELLMDVVETFGSRVQLTVAGKAADKRYERQVAERASRAGNVQLLPGFIPDSEMAARLAGADALALPYDMDSSLNSGTVLLAFSYKRTVICPDIGTIGDLGRCRGEVFHYTYTNAEEHRVALQQQIERAAMAKEMDPTALQRMGEHLFDYVAETCDPRAVGEELDKVYRMLIRRAT